MGEEKGFESSPLSLRCFAMVTDPMLTEAEKYLQEHPNEYKKGGRYDGGDYEGGKYDNKYDNKYDEVKEWKEKKEFEEYQAKKAYEEYENKKKLEALKEKWGGRGGH